jgi:hypothetical protein
MGYTTDFTGKFDLNKPLAPEHSAYLLAFAQTRRMKRDAAITATMDDPTRIAVGLPVGVDGEYFVGASRDFGQDHSPDILNYNDEPATQPGLWCQWIPNDTGTAIQWDGGEKFYNYIEWLKYLITHFLAPWGYVLNGAVEWCGEDRSDTGTISVINNVVRH